MAAGGACIVLSLRSYTAIGNPYSAAWDSGNSVETSAKYFVFASKEASLGQITEVAQQAWERTSLEKR